MFQTVRLVFEDSGQLFRILLGWGPGKGRLRGVGGPYEANFECSDHASIVEGSLGDVGPGSAANVLNPLALIIDNHLVVGFLL